MLIQIEVLRVVPPSEPGQTSYKLLLAEKKSNEQPITGQQQYEQEVRDHRGVSSQGALQAAATLKLNPHSRPEELPVRS